MVTSTTVLTCGTVVVAYSPDESGAERLNIGDLFRSEVMVVRRPRCNPFQLRLVNICSQSNSEHPDPPPLDKIGLDLGQILVQISMPVRDYDPDVSDIRTVSSIRPKDLLSHDAQCSRRVGLTIEIF